MKAISVKNLTYSYDEHHIAIDDISFNIMQGSYVSIIGPNGSGKSTLAKLIDGLISSNKGEIKIFDTTLDRKNVNKLRQRIGIVFQNPDNQFISSTVEDDIAFGLENQNVDPALMKDIVLEYAKKVKMSDYLDKEPSNLSGGQKQRVAIAGVLALNRDIIIFDEATSMLDPKGREDIRNLIKQLRKSNPNLTMLSITHDIEEAYLSDYVIILNKGKIVKQGNHDEIFSNLDELKSLGFETPFFATIKEKLQKRGYDLKNINNIEELINKLCQLM